MLKKREPLSIPSNQINIHSFYRSFILTENMKEEIKERLQRNETWQRALYMLFFIIIYGVSKFVIFAIILFQFITIILTGGTNEQMLKFGQNLSTYLYQITQFLTFNSEEHPFPFSKWPSGAPHHISQYID